MNIVLIIIDSLRRDHVGAYGNSWIHTPHLDTLATESVRFTRAYPESLPTLPVRRALHTGRRTFPYKGHRDFKGDFQGAPGWGPIPEEQQTLAEFLGSQGYRCALVTDVYHMFKPSKNFHRGFQQWEWIRGQEMDAYRSGPPVARDVVASHIPVALQGTPAFEQFLESYLRNNQGRAAETDYATARVFSAAARWLFENQDADNFFLVVDSFDPHEPWDPPDYYRKLYDPSDDVMNVIQSLYGPWAGKMTAREVRRLQANYAGEVTMVDRWLGVFMESLRLSGRLDDTVMAVISDHGHNLGYDPQDRGLISKQGHPLTHAVADLVMMVRHPQGQGAGQAFEGLVYNFDLTATLLALAGFPRADFVEGESVWPHVLEEQRAFRPYVTIGWGPLITVITDDWWYNANIWGEGELLYAVKTDALLQHNVAAEHAEVCQDLRRKAVDDAGGEIPAEFVHYSTRPGCTPFAIRYDNIGQVQKRL